MASIAKAPSGPCPPAPEMQLEFERGRGGEVAVRIRRPQRSRIRRVGLGGFFLVGLWKLTKIGVHPNAFEIATFLLAAVLIGAVSGWARSHTVLRAGPSGLRKDAFPSWTAGPFPARRLAASAVTRIEARYSRIPAAYSKGVWGTMTVASRDAWMLVAHVDQGPEMPLLDLEDRIRSKAAAEWVAGQLLAALQEASG